MLLSARLVVSYLSSWVDRIAQWCVYASAAGIFFIAALLAISSMKRYLFMSPISETEELGGLMFMATTFLALAHGLTQDRHVRLELLWRNLPGRWKDGATMMGYLLTMIALMVMISITWTATMETFAAQNRTVMTEILLWPWRLILPSTFTLLLMASALRFAALIFTFIDGAHARENDLT